MDQSWADSIECLALDLLYYKLYNVLVTGCYAFLRVSNSKVYEERPVYTAE